MNLDVTTPIELLLNEIICGCCLFSFLLKVGKF